jgi:hypothetical protein
VKRARVLFVVVLGMTSGTFSDIAAAAVLDLRVPIAAAGTSHCVGAADPLCGSDVHPTIPDAMAHATAGDTILVGPGTYPGFMISAGVTVRSTAGPAATMVLPPKPTPDGVVVSYSTGSVLDGFTVDSTGLTGGTVALVGAGSIVRNNVIVNSSATRVGIGIVPNAYNAAGGVALERNDISNFSAGVYLNRGAMDNVFSSNEVHDNAIGVITGAGDGGASGNRFFSNRFATNGTAIRFDAPVEAGLPNGINVFRHNCFAGNTIGFRVDTGNPVQDATGNFWGASDGATGHGGSGDSADPLVDADLPNETCVPEPSETGLGPVLTASPGSSASAPTVLREGGMYRLWYSTGTAIGYAESPDALTWVRSPDLVIDGAPARFQQPSVTRLGPSMLRLWWGTGNSSGTSTASTDYVIFTALSVDDGSTWGAASQVALPTGLEPDNYQLHVLPVAGGFFGVLQSGGTLYRLETTDPSATTWTTASILQGIPECLEVADTRCTSGMVTHDGAGYRLWYSTYQGGDVNDMDAIRYAVSEDGLRFVAETDPLLHADDGAAWRASRTTTPWVVQRGRGFDMFFSGRDAAAATAIGVASTSPLPLTVIDCDGISDDATAIQSVVDAIGSDATIALRGVCDFSTVAASGATQEGGVTTAAVIVPASADDLTIRSFDADAPATLLGSGTQAAIYVAPGSSGTSITGLTFAGFAQAVVVHNATDAIVGSTDPSPLSGNRIVGGPTTTAGILAIGSVDGNSVTVTGADGTAHSFATPSGQTLNGLRVLRNYISIDPPGADAVGVSVFQRGSGRILDTEIAGNAVGMFGTEFPSMNMVGIRVWARSGNDAPLMIDGVDITGNNLGRLEELGLVAPEAADVQSAGRFGILVNRAGNVTADGNGVRVRLSPTPGISMPGGGIVFGNVDTGSISGNGIIELTDQTTLDADLGAIGVIHRLSALMSGSGDGPATRNVVVHGNVIGIVSADGDPVGAAKGLVVNGAAAVTATANQFQKIEDRSIYIGATLVGFGPTGSAPTLPPRPVVGSTFCQNWLNTTSTAPGDRDTPRSEVVFVAGIGSSGNAFPGGHLHQGNGSC